MIVTMVANRGPGLYMQMANGRKSNIPEGKEGIKRREENQTETQYA
jgi:hypothetical protein